MLRFPDFFDEVSIMHKTAEELNTRNQLTYETFAREYAGPEVGEDDPHHRLACRNAFLVSLKGKDILEVGCGPGTDSKRFHDAGFNVLATDFCKPFLSIVNERYPDIPTSYVDMTSPFEVGIFDGIYGHSCFLHIAHELALQTLRHLRLALKPGGILFLAVIGTTKNNRYTIPNWGGHENNPAEFYCYSEVELQNLALEAGFKSVETLRIPWSPDSPYVQGNAKSRVDERGIYPWQLMAHG
jgi:SAM-dependent methyltransferase